MNISFDLKPDAVGMGRVVIDGRYYGLPAAAVARFAVLEDLVLKIETTQPETSTMGKD